MTLESTVSSAKKGTNSLRVTIPEGITEYLKVKAGDKLQWNMEERFGQRIVEVTKAHVLQAGEIKSTHVGEKVVFCSS